MTITYREVRDRSGNVLRYEATTDRGWRWNIFPHESIWDYKVVGKGIEFTGRVRQIVTANLWGVRAHGEPIEFSGESPIDVHDQISGYVRQLIGGTFGIKEIGLDTLRRWKPRKPRSNMAAFEKARRTTWREA